MSAARLLDPRRDLHDPSRFVRIEGLPILDTHTSQESGGKGDVSEATLRRIVTNTNDRISRGDPPAVTAGHTARKTTILIVKPDGSQVVLPATSEDAQPDVLGYASGFRMGNHNGKSCVFADWHIHREHADKITQFPYRSAERLVATNGVGGDFIDRIAALKSPPERDLGAMIAYEQGDRTGVHAEAAGLRRIVYERSCCSYVSTPSRQPAINPRSHTPMSSNNTLKRLAYEASTEMLEDLFRIDQQAAQLTRLRDDQNIALPDHELDRIANLDPDEFAREFETVRTCYARDTTYRVSGSWLRDPSAGVASRALDYSHRHGIPYREARRHVGEAQDHAARHKVTQAEAEEAVHDSYESQKPKAPPLDVRMVHVLAVQHSFHRGISYAAARAMVESGELS